MVLECDVQDAHANMSGAQDQHISPQRKKAHCKLHPHNRVSKFSSDYQAKLGSGTQIL